MSDYLLLTAPGATYTPKLVALTGDRLIHPRDVPSDIARIVIRWGRAWWPHTIAARNHFTKTSGDDGGRGYCDRQVSGWLFLSPDDGSLAGKVRSGELDVATALSVEAEVWPMLE
ncbi:hypothetical protein [Amycolatopsis minnesotensis]|uniref:Uncharacterized protein n=1 Tax=Amycolatopsis minnesotensis TaxID=337894 RepID=A0ABP5BN76_9PSEU